MALSRQERARGVKGGGKIGDTSDRNLVALLRNHHRSCIMSAIEEHQQLCFSRKKVRRRIVRMTRRLKMKATTQEHRLRRGQA